MFSDCRISTCPSFISLTKLLQLSLTCLSFAKGLKLVLQMFIGPPFQPLVSGRILSIRILVPYSSCLRSLSWLKPFIKNGVSICSTKLPRSLSWSCCLNEKVLAPVQSVLLYTLMARKALSFCLYRSRPFQKFPWLIPLMGKSYKFLCKTYPSESPFVC